MRIGLVRRIILTNLTVVFCAAVGLAFLHRQVTGLEAEERSLLLEAKSLALALRVASESDDVRRDHRLSMLMARVAELSGLQVGLYAQTGFAVRARPEAITVRSPLPGGDVGFFTRTSRDVGRLIISRFMDGSGRVQPLSMPDHVREAFTGREVAYIRRLSPKDAAVAAVKVTLHQQDFILDVTFPETRLYQLMEREGRAYLTYFAVVLLATLAISLFLGTSIAQPLARLSHQAQNVAKRTQGLGDIDTLAFQEFARRGDEIGHLSDAIRGLVVALRERLVAVDDFAADVAHELKNPLTALRTSVELLERPHDAERQAKLLTAMRRDLQRLHQLIDDIQASARLERELGDGPSEHIALIELLEELVAQRMASAERLGFTIQFLHDDDSLFVEAKGQQLIHALANILDNAISFSEVGGKILVQVRMEKQNAHVIIDDEGPGIPEALRSRVFERFYSTRLGVEGHSGLGLGIAKQILSRHGGDISLDDSPLGGLRVVMTLPLVRAK